MSAMPTEVRDASRAASPRATRVAVVLDPANASARLPDDSPGLELHLHLAQLAEITPGQPLLRRADVLIIEVMLGEPGQLELFERLTADQHMPVIAAGRDLTVAGTRALIRAGAVDVLPLPIDPADLEHAIAAARRVLALRPTEAAVKGRVVSFVGAVGGAGATAIASQCGCLWATSQSTCLIDFDIQFGAAALYLDMQPRLGLIDLIDARDRLDTTLFQTVAARHPTGLHVVAGPSEMVSLDVLTPTLSGQILTMGAQLFDVVLLDLPAAWTAWSMAALSQSDAVCLVTSLSVPGLRQARRQLDLIEANGLTVPIRIVLNRVPKKIFRTIDLGDCERVLRRKVDFTIANDFPTVSSAIDQGRAIGAVRAKSQVEKDLATLVVGLKEVVAA